ncbi:hypothetical protein BCV70DRAFT_19429 [Testicularia cyperi]|uniref:Uncharacterized protein n=1 Tax=Testicularia cyperi TaxID=1882483 RepID=A0A317XZ43_9BASI|nr:hypothetical protein BCV70DRAFT_19429 [Testicularia cyperi]
MTTAPDLTHASKFGTATWRIASGRRRFSCSNGVAQLVCESIMLMDQDACTRCGQPDTAADRYTDTVSTVGCCKCVGQGCRLSLACVCLAAGLVYGWAGRPRIHALRLSCVFDLSARSSTATCRPCGNEALNRSLASDFHACPPTSSFNRRSARSSVLTPSTNSGANFNFPLP